MPKIVLGTANFDKHYGITKNKFLRSNIRTRLPYVLKKNKINYFDTALDYYFPTNLFRSLKVKNLKIITKIKIPKKNKERFIKNLKNKVYRKIRDLKITRFEAILIHNVKDLSSKYGKRFKQILFELKIEKKTKMIGASLYSPKEIKKTMKFLKPDIIQFPLNIFNTSFVSSKWKKYFIKNNIKIQIRSVFLQGLLLKKKKTIDKLKLNKQLRQHLSRYNSWISLKNLNHISTNVNFIKKYFRMIDYIIIGSDNYLQFLQTLKLLNSKEKNNLKIKNFSTLNNKIIDPRKW